MKIKVYDMLGNEAGEMELSDSIFGAQINVPLMHEMVKNYLANRRHGTQSTLTRSEVSGGGKKPWRQKGTGRARQGSMGANSTPSKVMKGKGMPGHMGSEQVTIQNLSVVKVDAENNLIAIKGAIPGPNGGLVVVKTAVKK